MVDISLKYVDLYGDLERDYKEFFKESQKFEYPFGTIDSDDIFGDEDFDDDYYASELENDCLDDYEVGH